jgi:predicted lipoprotein with Yx(FWY)xxD motif
MKKSSTVAIIVIVVLIVIGGGYALLHTSKKPTTAKNMGASSSTQATAVNNSVVVTKTNASLGQYLAEPAGKALYTYGGDSAGVSKCSGSCLASWPAYQDKGATTGLPTGIGTIQRSDNGETQYTYNGMPLYTFVGDSGSQVTGNGVSNFTIAKPAAASTSTGSSTSAPTSNSNSGYTYP